MERRKKEAVEKEWGLVRLLGEGAFGVVWEAEHKESGARAAVKIQRPKGSRGMAEVVGEARLGMELSSLGPGSGLVGVEDMCVVASLPVSWRGPLVDGMALVSAKDAAEDPFPSVVKAWRKVKFKGPFTLVFSVLGSGGTLDGVLARASEMAQPMPLDEVTSVAAQLVNSTRILHHLIQYQHCDLKPENVVLLGDGAPAPAGLALADHIPRTALIDFGLAEALDEGSHAGGTMGYISPEVFFCGGAQRGVAADAWAVGIIMLEMAVTGHDGLCYRAKYGSVMAIQHLTEVLVCELALNELSPVRELVDLVMDASAETDFICDDITDAATVIAVCFIQAALGNGSLPEDTWEEAPLFAALDAARDTLSTLAHDPVTNPYLDLFDAVGDTELQAGVEAAAPLLAWTPGERPDLADFLITCELFQGLRPPRPYLAVHVPASPVPVQLAPSPLAPKPLAPVAVNIVHSRDTTPDTTPRKPSAPSTPFTPRNSRAAAAFFSDRIHSSARAFEAKARAKDRLNSVRKSNPFRTPRALRILR